MGQETFDYVWAVVILVAFLAAAYGVGRILDVIETARRVRLLSPLAPLIGGAIDRTGPWITGVYQGREVRVSITPGQSVGTGDTATTINAFHIEVMGLRGAHDWRAQFEPGGTFGLGAKCLEIVAREGALQERLARSGVAAEIAAVSAPTECYVVVAFDARRQMLTFTDDVKPRRTPPQDRFAAQLALAVRLAQVNEQVNRAEATR